MKRLLPHFHHPLRTTVLLLQRAVHEFFADNCTQMAAAISYYVLFSVFPLVIFIVGILGLLLQDSALQDDVIEAILELIPLSEGEGEDNVSVAVRDVAGVGSGALGALGLIGMAWSGSNMMGVIRRSINTAYDLERHRPLLRQKLLDLALVLGLGLFFLTSVATTAFLRTAREFSDDLDVVGNASQQAGLLWDGASYAIPLLFSIIAFTVLYWIVPATKVKIHEVWPGALLAAIFFELGKIGFTFYLTNFSNYGLVYGSLGAVVAFLFWVYLGSQILLFGAEVASEYPRVLRGDYDTVEQAQSKPRLPPRERVKRLLRSLLHHDDDHHPER